MAFFDRLKSAYKELRFPNSSTGQTNGSGVLYLQPDNWLYNNGTTTAPARSQPSADPCASSLVFSGVRWLGNTLPEPPIEVMKPAGDGEDDTAVDNHPMVKLLKRPNPYTSGASLWKSFAYSWIIRGNVFLIKKRNVLGQVVELWYEPHWSIRPRWKGDHGGVYIPGSESQSHASVPRNDKDNQFINYYEVDRDFKQNRIEVADVVHFRDFFGVDPENSRLGISGIATILREIYGDSAAADYAGGLLAAGGVPPFVLSVNDSLVQIKPEDITEISDRLQRSVKTGKPMVITNATVERMGLTAQEVDMRTSRYLSEERFSAVTGIPLEVLNLGAGNEHSTFNNVQQADRAATTRYLIPLWWYRDEELTVQLLKDFDTDESHYVESDTSEVGALQEDENAKWDRVGKAYQAQFITRKEARDLVDLESDEGGADDVYLVKAGTETMTLDQEEENRNNPPEQQAPVQLAAVGQKKRMLQSATPMMKQLYSAK